MKTFKIVTAAVLGLAASGSGALEIDPNVIPEISLGGRMLATVDWMRVTDAAGEVERASALNVSDSSLVLGFSKYLFSDPNYGYATLGFKTSEDGNDLKDDIYFHELSVGIGGPRYEIRLGRTRLPNTLLSFPTVRDDDLLAFTVVGNGASNTHAVEYQQFGGQAAAHWWLTPRVSGAVAVTARTQTDLSGAPLSGEAFNGGSVMLSYDFPEAMQVRSGFRFIGLTLDYQDLEALGTSPKEKLATTVGAFSYHLGSNPEAAWLLDVQGIVTRGVTVTELEQPYQRARAKSRTVVAALRYAHRPNLQTRWQAALTVAQKNYTEFSDARSVALVPSFAWRVGSGVNVVAQYRHIRNGNGLVHTADEQDKQHQHVLIGVHFNFAATFNESVGERGDILNFEHNMLDFGPVMGGH